MIPGYTDRMRAILLTTVLAACSGVDPAEECEVAADAWADKVSTCLIADYQTAYERFTGPEVQWDCANVHDLRDVDALRDQCVPWLTGMDCSLADDVYDEREPFISACVDQLQP